MRELLRDMRLGSIDLFSPKLALGYLICRDVSRSVMGTGEDETMQAGAVYALEGISEGIAEQARLHDQHGSAIYAMQVRRSAELAALLSDLLRKTGGK
jgi:hypothetical protein